MYVYVYMYMYIDMYVMCVTCVCICLYNCVVSHTLIYIYIYICIYIYVYIYIYVCTVFPIRTYNYIKDCAGRSCFGAELAEASHHLLLHEFAAGVDAYLAGREDK